MNYELNLNKKTFIMQRSTLMAVCFCAALSLGTAIVCPKNYCKQVVCEPIVGCMPGKIMDKTFCGCCNRCIPERRKGEHCFMGFSLSVPPPSRCEPGTFCDNGICKIPVI